VRALLAALLVLLVLPQAAAGARYAVGARDVEDLPRLERALGGGASSLAPLPALVVERATAPRLRDLPGATYVERLRSRRLAWAPNDPFVPKQWHLATNRAFDYWPSAPSLLRVRVAVVDSGIDGGHPELEGRVFAHRSFVGGSALQDQQGHGTFVAGLIAAAVDNAQGIAGMAPSADLLVAKVVDGDGTIDIEAEARAIRWAVDQGAQVINMSLGGVRDPRDAENDTFSPLEAAAIGYAKRRGVVVVAAVGNGDASPRQPWPYATYPAALPHVLGVSAITREGGSPAFSNRDAVYNDIAAPGQGLLSTFPRALTAPFRECAEQGYSSCGPDEWRRAEGTSFAAPQVSAAAAILLAVRPALGAEQVTALLTRTAVDMNAATGCKRCPLERDELTGWGRLDVTAALRALGGPLPPRDRLEPNDDAGPQAVRLWGQTRRLSATLDFWDDQNDVYAIKLRRGQPVYVSVRGPRGTDTNLVLWRPATKSVDDLRSLSRLAAQSARPGPREYLSFRAPRAGWYFVQVKLGSRGAGRYRLTVVKA
jgi:thermitase